MGALAAAGCAWRGTSTVRSGRGCLGAVVARHAAVRVQWGLSQRPVRVDCGLSYTTVQASAIVACLIYYFNIYSHSEQTQHHLHWEYGPTDSRYVWLQRCRRRMHQNGGDRTGPGLLAFSCVRYEQTDNTHVIRFTDSEQCGRSIVVLVLAVAVGVGNFFCRTQICRRV